MDGVFTKSAAMSSVCSSHCSLNSWNLLAGGAPAGSQISALQGMLVCAHIGTVSGRI